MRNGIEIFSEKKTNIRKAILMLEVETKVIHAGIYMQTREN